MVGSGIRVVERNPFYALMVVAMEADAVTRAIHMKEMLCLFASLLIATLKGNLRRKIYILLKRRNWKKCYRYRPPPMTGLPDIKVISFHIHKLADDATSHLPPIAQAQCIEAFSKCVGAPIIIFVIP
jgi:hypothetical protein